MTVIGTRALRILPRPFDEMTFEDVAKMTAGGGDDETLVLEVKETLRTEHVSKGCAAFSNTIGGLLVGGVNSGGSPDGMARPEHEVETWVTNCLRNLVAPMPPFRARWIPLPTDPTENRGLLLVLAFESTITPHLHIQNGVIYVRSPGSSHPVPISDHRALLDLVRRGDEARAEAVRWARHLHVSATHEPMGSDQYRLVVVLAPTGCSPTLAESPPFGTAGALAVGDALRGAFPNETAAAPIASGGNLSYEQASVALTRLVTVDRAATEFCQRVMCTSTACVTLTERARYLLADSNGPGAIDAARVTSRLARMVDSAQKLAASSGGHGEARLIVGFAAAAGVHLQWPGHRFAIAENRDLVVERWLEDSTEASINAACADILEELARAHRLGPPVAGSIPD